MPAPSPHEPIDLTVAPSGSVDVPVVMPESNAAEALPLEIGQHASTKEQAERDSKRSRQRRRKRSGRTSKVSPRANLPSSEGEATIGGARTASPSMLSSSESTSAQTQEHYQTIEEIGRGGWGVVTRAFDRRLEREVAIKSLSASVGQDASARQSFENEARLTSQLQHPGIVPVHEAGKTEQGESFYAMKLLEGNSLRDVIRSEHASHSGSSPTRQRGAFMPLLERFISVCNAVAYAHNRGIIHRDLKPANVMIGNFGETLVVDWGLATQADSIENQRRRNPGESTQVGTPAYMSPEQAKGVAAALCPASDIYSLGVILFEILAGTSPCVWAESTSPRVDSKPSVTERILDRVSQGDLPSLREVNPLAPKSLEAVCQKAMALDQDDRYCTAEELADEVRRYVEGNVPTVYNEPLLDKAIRWGARHKAITSVTLAAGSILLIASIVFGAVISDAHRSEQVARLAAEDARQQALERLAKAREAADSWLIDLSGSLQFYPGMQPIRENLLTSALEDYEDLIRSTKSHYSAAKSSLSDVQQLLEASRLHIRINDLNRLLVEKDGDQQDSAKTSSLVQATQLLDEAEHLVLLGLAEDEPAEETQEFDKEVRLERVNLFIAQLLSGETELTNEAVEAHAALLFSDAAGTRSQDAAQCPRRLVEIAGSTAKSHSALVRLFTVSGREALSTQQRIKFAQQATTHAEILLEICPSVANLRLLETALTTQGGLYDETLDSVKSTQTWGRLVRLLRNRGDASRSDQMQSLAFAMMNQANALSASDAQKSVELLDEAIDVLHRAWDAMDPDAFFETNIATANFNSAKLLIARNVEAKSPQAEMPQAEMQQIAERLRASLHIYQRMLQSGPTGDTLRRLADCHLLLARLLATPQPSLANGHFESFKLAHQMLIDHQLSTVEERLLLVRVEFEHSILLKQGETGLLKQDDASTWNRCLTAAGQLLSDLESHSSLTGIQQAEIIELKDILERASSQSDL